MIIYFEFSVAEAAEFEIGKLIGQGGYGFVYIARHQYWNTVAYKKLPVEIVQKCDEDGLITEAKIHLRLAHPNIVKCLSIIFEPGHYGLILEYMEHGEIRNYLSQNKNSQITLSFVHDVALGMDYLHCLDPPVIHGDLKIRNVLLGKDLKARICDFGFSIWKNYSQSHSANTVALGTLTHVPPERLKNNTLRKNEASDVYSFGITVWEMTTLQDPFKHAAGNQSLVQYWIMHGQRPDIEEPSWKSLPQSIIDMVYTSWQEEADKRRRSQIS